MQDFVNKLIGSTPVDVLIIFGLIKALQWLLKFLCMVWRHTCRPKCCQGRNRVYKRYGAKAGGSWAVITGGSDGIGLAMCKKLAKEGFNICIVSRSPDKIEEKLKEVTKECRDGDASFKTLAVVADLWKMRTIQEYQTVIADKLVNLDVAVLVLNAGFAQVGPFVDISNEEVERLCQVNLNHVLYTAKVMLPQLVKRYDTQKLKSGMVVTSSVAALAPVSGTITYCAAKTFSSYIAEGLNYELLAKVDIMSYQPGGVTTKMLGKRTTDMTTISTEMAADVCFRDLGHSQSTSGAYRHEQLAFIIQNIPKRWIQWMFFPQSKKIFAKIRARQARESQSNQIQS